MKKEITQLAQIKIYSFFFHLKNIVIKKNNNKIQIIIL